MARFNTNTFCSLNESIARVQNPQAALNEAMEYTAALEAIILDLCEALDLDPQALVEDALTGSGAELLAKKRDKANARVDKAYSHEGNTVNQDFLSRRQTWAVRGPKRKAGAKQLKNAHKNWSKVEKGIKAAANSKTVYTAGAGGKLKKASKGTKPKIRSADEFDNWYRPKED